jgi:hypothetical protein
MQTALQLKITSIRLYQVLIFNSMKLFATFSRDTIPLMDLINDNYFKNKLGHNNSHLL